LVRNAYVTEDGVDVAVLAIVSTLCVSVVRATAVEVVIAAAAMFVAPANVAPTVRVPRCIACAAALVITPVATVTVHVVPAASVAEAAVNVSVAVAVPELEPAAVNVVAPQPLVVGVAGDPATVKLGSTSAILSAAWSAVFKLNSKATEVGAAVTGLASVSELCVTLVGSSVDVAMAVAATLSAPANVTATVRVFRFAACAMALVVTPVITDNVHDVPAASVPLPAVNINVLPDPEDVNVVV
jgi:hypothetical protein